MHGKYCSSHSSATAQ